jgi:hypothetical protein
VYQSNPQDKGAATHQAPSRSEKKKKKKKAPTTEEF